MPLTFEWDENKSAKNEKKHGITFGEAKTVFNDPFAITIDEPGHSDGEYRFLDIGFSSKGEVLVVWYTPKETKIYA